MEAYANQLLHTSVHTSVHTYLHTSFLHTYLHTSFHTCQAYANQLHGVLRGSGVLPTLPHVPSFVVDAAGTAYTFGGNESGRLGLGDLDDRKLPTAMETLALA